MDNHDYEVIVIGSGPGGLACATLLQKRGTQTLLVEKNDALGGKMMSIDKDGWAYDLFPHGQVPMRGSAFETVFAELGVSDEFEPALEPDDPRDVVTLCYRRREWDTYKTVTQKQALDDPEPFFKLWEATEDEQAAALAVLTEMVTMSDAEIGALDNMTMEEWLSERDVPAPLYNYLGFHANASLAEPLDLVAASEQILIMKQIMLQGGGGQYKGGFGGLTMVMAREFEKNGGTIVTRAKVERITVDDGAVTGVETTKGNFSAPVVVSSAGIHPTVLKLVGEEHFDRGYVDYVKGLVPGWAFTSVRYFLDRPVMDTAIYAVWSDDSWLDTARFRKQKEGEEPDEVILFMCNHSFYDEHAAPPGKQVLVSGTVCSPDPDAREIEGLWSCMDRQMKELFPEIWEATERKEYNGPRQISELTRDAVLPGQGGECVGLAQIIGQCGSMKPSSETSVRGLYLAGADAGAAGMGTHQSALSGIEVARLARHCLNKMYKAQ
ncbi:MAG: FAD-dependent oxidoreductase [Acidimicrobiia bacterium]